MENAGKYITYKISLRACGNSVEKVETPWETAPLFTNSVENTVEKWISPSGSTKNGYNRLFWHSSTATAKPFVHREFLEWPGQTWYNKNTHSPV